MSILKYSHLKKNDKVIVLSGDFKSKIGVVTKVVRQKEDSNRFLIALDCLPKKRLKRKKSNEFVEKDTLIDSSNLSLLKVKDDTVVVN